MANEQRDIRQAGDVRDTAATGAATGAWNSIVRRGFMTPPPPTPTPTPVPTPTPTPVPTPTPTPVPTPTPGPTDEIDYVDGLFFKEIVESAGTAFAIFHLHVKDDNSLPPHRWTIRSEAGDVFTPEVYLDGDWSSQQGYPGDGSGHDLYFFVRRSECTSMKLETRGAWYAAYDGDKVSGATGDAAGKIWGTNCGGGGVIANISPSEMVSSSVHSNGAYDVISYKAELDVMAGTPIGAFTLVREHDGAVLRPFRMYFAGQDNLTTLPGGQGTFYIEASTGCTPFTVDGKWRVEVNGSPLTAFSHVGGTINFGTGPCP